MESKSRQRDLRLYEGRDKCPGDSDPTIHEHDKVGEDVRDDPVT